MREEMTREQARDTLRNAAWLGTDEEREQIEKAVELLCGEPCEDTISRHDSIAALIKHFSDDDMIETEYGAYWHHGHVIDVLQGMRPVTPMQRTGHWIKRPHGFKCSKCLIVHPRTSIFCPNCGAKMVEP